MPGTSCKEAIRLWEEKHQKPAAEEETVKLYAQVPPIEKMDDSLNQLEACVHLSLSTNSIERIISLSKLKNLKILSLGRNQIKRLVCLEDIGLTLEQLWISYNIIEKLDGLQPCVKLHTLFISNNKIKVWDEVAKLSNSPELKNLLILGNPIYDEAENRLDMIPSVVKRVPQIEQVDGEMIDDHTRQLAEKAVP